LLTPLAVSLLVFLIVKAVLSQDDSHVLLFMMLGMVVALVAKTKAADRRVGG
jgi:hypothetical protein